MVQPVSQLTMGNITLDKATFELSSTAGSFSLANKEYQMLEMMMRNPRQIISAERFMERIWGYDSEADSHTLDVHIARLRERLKSNQDFKIVTLRGVGYKVVKL